MDLIGYEPRLSACGCKGFCNTTSGVVVRALSYPETSGFATSVSVLTLPSLSATPSRFPLGCLPPYDGLISLALQNRSRSCDTTPVRDLHSLSPLPGLDPLTGPAVSLSPSTLPGSEQSERVEQSIAAPSARCGVANPTRGTTLRRKLRPHWRCGRCRSGGPTCPCGRVYSAAWRAARWVLFHGKPMAQAAERACCAHGFARAITACPISL
jgi:hypothetical protein